MGGGVDGSGSWGFFVISDHDHLDAVAMQQIDRDVVVVCHGSKSGSAAS